MQKIIVLDKCGELGHTQDLEVELQVYDTETTDDVLDTTLIFSFDTKAQCYAFANDIEDNCYELRQLFDLVDDYTYYFCQQCEQTGTAYGESVCSYCQELNDKYDLENMSDEDIKFEKVKDNIENKILYHRYNNLEELNEVLESEFGITASKCSSSQENADECGVDFNLLAGINEDWGYVDIYYLKDNSDRMLITEITVSED